MFCVASIEEKLFALNDVDGDEEDEGDTDTDDDNEDDKFDVEHVEDMGDGGK